MITKQQVLKALSTVEDPDLKKDLVSLGMIKDIEITSNKISFAVVLTTPACPLKEQIRKECEKAIRKEVSNQTMIDISMQAQVSTTRNTQVNILPNVKNIICVASGKGGVGKSTISVNLACALCRKGAKVGIIDADIHGPSLPTMLGIVGKRPSVREIKGKHYIEPFQKEGIKVLSIGLLVDERQAVVWRGAMVSSALKQFVTDTLWGNLDYLIIDMPPGTGDVHLTLFQTIPITAAVLVSTPQQVALSDTKKALGMFRMPNINVPVIGIVENMAYFTPAELPDNKYYLFGKDGGKQLSQEYEIPLLGQIPVIQSIQEDADQGIFNQENNARAQLYVPLFDDLASKVAQQVALRNAQIAPTEVVHVAQ